MTTNEVSGRPERCCVVCGGSLTGRRSEARVCGGPCRAERSRLRAILNSSERGPYSSVAQRLGRAHKRTRWPTGDSEQP
jgi:hypothetical protein